MKDAIVIGLLVLILGLAIYAIYRSKKSGKKCIGCPYSGNCASECQRTTKPSKHEYIRDKKPSP